MKSFKIQIPRHTYGRSFRFDFPISCKREEGVVGVCAILKDTEADDFYSIINPVERTVANISITTDGEVLYPSVPVISLSDGQMVPLTKMLQPVDYIKLGNKLSIVVEECNDLEGIIAYEIQIFMKTKRLL